MRASTLVVSAALLGLSCAQFAGLPNCATACLDKFVTGSSIGDCSNIDIHCICSSGGFLDSIACCLSDTCDKADIASTIKYAKSICATAEPPVVVPDAVVCSSATSKLATSAPATSKSAASSGSAEPTGATATTTEPPASSPTVAAAASSSTGAAALHKAGGVGVGFAGGLAAALVLL